MILEYDQLPSEKMAFFLGDVNELDTSLQFNPFAKIIVFEQENRVCAYLLYSLLYDRIEIEQLQVYVVYRRQHIATKLLQYLEQIAFSKKVKNISLEVSSNNTAAISLYCQFQFQKVAIRPNYYHGVDGILMMKEF